MKIFRAIEKFFWPLEKYFGIFEEFIFSVNRRILNVFLGNPRAAVDFTLPIRAQQVSDPVAEEFSLNTTFVLLSKRELWLADSQMQVTETSDVAFPEG